MRSEVRSVKQIKQRIDKFQRDYPDAFISSTVTYRTNITRRMRVDRLHRVDLRRVSSIRLIAVKRGGDVADVIATRKLVPGKTPKDPKPPVGTPDESFSESGFQSPQEVFDRAYTFLREHGLEPVGCISESVMRSAGSCHVPCVFIDEKYNTGLLSLYWRLEEGVITAHGDLRTSQG